MPHKLSPLFNQFKFLILLIIMASVILLPTKVVSYQIEIPYEDVEEYSVQSPYETQEQYIESVPYTEQEPYQDTQCAFLGLFCKGVTKYRTVTKYKDVIKTKSVTKYRDETRYRKVQKVRMETRYKEVNWLFGFDVILKFRDLSKLNIITSQETIKTQQPQIKREGYNPNDKPFDNRNYVYDERTNDFRFVCSSPCLVSKTILDQEFAAINYAVSTLRALTKSNLDEDILPFEVHASEDTICQFNPSALAYMTIFTDSNGYNRGLLCFFFEKLQYDRSKFPYSTSVHEVTHLFEYGKLKHNAVIWEGLSEMMESFFLKGNDKNSFCWQGNAWYKGAMSNSHDPHWIGGNLFFELCNQYRFDYQNLPELFKRLDAKNGNVDEREFVGIINDIVKADTSHLFKNAGVI